MGEDITEEFIAGEAEEEVPPESPEEVQEQKIKTKEALEKLGLEDVINKATAFLINKYIMLTARKLNVEVKEEDKIKPEEVKEIGFGEAVIRTIDYYFPEIPMGHPVVALIGSGLVLGSVALMKIETVKMRAEVRVKKEKKAEKTEKKEEKKEENEGKEGSNEEVNLLAMMMGMQNESKD